MITENNPKFDDLNKIDRLRLLVRVAYRNLDQILVPQDMHKTIEDSLSALTDEEIEGWRRKLYKSKEQSTLFLTMEKVYKEIDFEDEYSIYG